MSGTIGFGLGFYFARAYFKTLEWTHVRTSRSLDTDRPQKTFRRSRLAWKRSWDRPMRLDESSLDPLTAARMTDHNVR